MELGESSCQSTIEPSILTDEDHFDISPIASPRPSLVTDSSTRHDTILEDSLDPESLLVEPLLRTRGVGGRIFEQDSLSNVREAGNVASVAEKSSPIENNREQGRRNRIV